MESQYQLCQLKLLVMVHQLQSDRPLFLTNGLQFPQLQIRQVLAWLLKKSFRFQPLY